MTRPPARRLSEMNQTTVGAIGIVLTALLVAVALNFSAIRSSLSDTSFTAQLAETGGLQKGDDVRVSGVTVGHVDKLALDGDHITVSFKAAGVRLGDDSTASVKSENALGRKFLAISPAGPGETKTIPLDHTDSGYNVTAALGNLATDVGQIDLPQMTAALDSLGGVLDQVPAQFKLALDGVSSLSHTVASRDAELNELLAHTASLSGILAQRNKQITDILANGSLLFHELDARRKVIAQLLVNVQQATSQLLGLVHDNKDSLKPALEQIDRVAGILKKYRHTLDYALNNLHFYVSGLGEAVGSGPFFQAYVQNITAPGTLLPDLGSLLGGKTK